jgi:hypothetical protein
MVTFGEEFTDIISTSVTVREWGRENRTEMRLEARHSPEKGLSHLSQVNGTKKVVFRV